MVKKKTLIVRNHHTMVCALPEEAFKEIQQAFIRVVLKYKNDAIGYNWTMTTEDGNENDLPYLYAYYPYQYMKDNYSEGIGTAFSLTATLYGNDIDNFWCESEEEAKEIVNNKYLREIAKEEQ